MVLRQNVIEGSLHFVGAHTTMDSNLVRYAQIALDSFMEFDSTYSNNVFLGSWQGCRLGGTSDGLLFAHNLCYGTERSGLWIDDLAGSKTPIRIENNIIDVRAGPSTENGAASAVEFARGVTGVVFRNNDFVRRPSPPGGWPQCIAKTEGSDSTCTTDPNAFSFFASLDGSVTATGNVSIIPDYAGPSWSSPEIAGFKPTACALRAKGYAASLIPKDILGVSRGNPPAIGPFECQ